MIRMAAVLAALLAVPAAGQVVSPLAVPTLNTSTLATKAEVDAKAAEQLAALQALIPRPAAAVPPTEMIGGTVGTAGTYRPADAAQPRITRAGVVATDTNGNWSVAWSTPLGAVPTVLPVPINTTSQPIVCNVATRSTTVATGRCWLARTLPATIAVLTSLVTYDVFGAPASGVSVQVIALPPTQ